MSQATDLIADFAAEVSNTRKLLEAVPEGQLDWKPHQKSSSLAALAGHIAETPNWLGTMLEDEMDFAAMTDYVPFVPTTKAELLEAFEQGAAAFAAPLEGQDDAFMSATWTMRKEDQVLMQAPRGQLMRSILLHHLIHHRGQLTVYLRMLNVPVPATYGGSADEPMF